MSPVTLLNVDGCTNHRMRADRFLVSLGAYGWTQLLIWANHESEAIDIAIDWAAANAPGLLANDAVSEAYAEALAEGKSEEQAREYAEVDTVQGGNCGDYLHSWEVHISRVNRREILALREAHGFNLASVNW